MARGRQWTILLLVLAGASGQEPASEAPAAPSPNLLIVLPDQWRGQALGFLDEDPVLTPNLDRLAEESLVLTQAVSNYPVCSPYRGMWMSGKYPFSNGVLSNCNSRGAQFGYELRTTERCWSDVLHDRGYSLGYIGKWHLDSPRRPYVKCRNNSEKFAWNEWCPPARRHGFDFWYAYGTYDYHLTPLYWATDTPRESPIRVEQWGPEHEADVAIRYLRNEGGKYRRPGRPFALVVAMNPPHMPYQLVPKRYVEKYRDRTPEQLAIRKNVDLSGKSRMSRLARNQTRNYFAMMTGVDDQVGRILKALDRAGLAENTIVVFTSDHGNCIGSHGQVSKNNHYEESMRVPFLIRWQGRISARHDGLLFSTPDLYPTLLDLMGFARDIPAAVEGVSHAALFLTGKGPRPTSQPYIFVPPGQPTLGRRGVRTHRYTFMIEKRKGRPDRTVLHDNVADPYQLRNIARERPEVVETLTETELRPWLRKMKDPWQH